MSKVKRIAYTPGEPAGIGSDLILQLANEDFGAQIVVFGCIEQLAARASTLNVEVSFRRMDWKDEPYEFEPNTLWVHSVELANPYVCQSMDEANREGVLASLRQAHQFCREGKVHAMVTGPVHKGVLSTNQAPFSGHTDFLAQLCDTPRYMMAFDTPDCLVGLATTHIPLVDVSSALNEPRLLDCIQLMHEALKNQYQISNPLIGVCGLNPHASEDGLMGHEEAKVIIPAIERARALGLNVEGPLPGDTAFTPMSRTRFDGILAMFHDQGLAPIKALSFGDCVNVTLGLPIIRTSVDHGTAFSLAGTGQANTLGLKHAFKCALKLKARS